MFSGVTQWFIALLVFTSFSSVGAPTVDQDAPIKILSGSWQQGAVIRGVLPQGYKANFMGRDLQLTPRGEFVIGLGRDFPKVAQLSLTDSQNNTIEHRFDVVQREYKIQRIEGVPNKTVNPNAEQVKRSRKEAALARNARKQVIERDDFLNDFKWPLVGIITGVYGSQRYYNGEPRRPHYGIDIAKPTGTPVVAPNSGVVTLVHPDMFFSGGTLILDHGYGLSSSFIHLSKILVNEGAVVEKGQVIAEVGATGRATGAHLDWRMNWFDQRVDPQLLVGDMPKE